jgi:hypothetical protein
MFPYTTHPKIFDQPLLLSAEDQKTPETLIRRFLDDYKLRELRDLIGHCNYLCMVVDVPPFNDPEERANILLYHHRVEELYEALHLLASQGYISKIGKSSKSE